MRIAFVIYGRPRSDLGRLHLRPRAGGGARCARASGRCGLAAVARIRARGREQRDRGWPARGGSRRLGTVRRRHRRRVDSPVGVHGARGERARRARPRSRRAGAQPAQRPARRTAALDQDRGRAPLLRRRRGRDRGLLAHARRRPRSARAAPALPGRDVPDATTSRRTSARTRPPRAPSNPGPLRVLHVAAVQPHKGLDRLLAAIARASAGMRRARFHARRRRRQRDRYATRAGFADRLRRWIWATRVRFHGERARRRAARALSAQPDLRASVRP